MFVCFRVKSKYISQSEHQILTCFVVTSKNKIASVHEWKKYKYKISASHKTFIYHFNISYHINICVSNINEKKNILNNFK